MHRLVLSLTCFSLLAAGSFPGAQAALNLGAPQTTVTRAQAVTYLYEQFEQDIIAKNAAIPTISFMDVPAGSPLLPLLGTFCAAEALSCTGGDFQPDQPVSMPSVLKMYDVLLHHYTDAPFDSVPREKRTQPDWNLQYMTWGEQRGLIPANMVMVPINHQAMQDFLAKDTYLRSWGYALPDARPMLPATLGDISDQTITTRAELDAMRAAVQRYHASIEGRRSSVFRAARDQGAATRLAVLRVGLDHLAHFMDQHPLYYDASFSAEERAEFRRLGLKEILGVGDYDFRTNPSYRKHNIRTTLKHIHKMVLQPGEEFDYWKVMNAGGMEDVVNGWVILEGKEVWAWGGGLCGTSTAIFRGAWFAGLEITERRPHSIYYQSLYGKDLGLDAAVYQNSPNLRFKNNTGNPVMLYLRYNETQDFSHVMVLGTKHFTNFEFAKGARRGKSIQHSRILTMKDGTVWTDPLFSIYNKLE